MGAGEIAQLLRATAVIFFLKRTQIHSHTAAHNFNSGFRGSSAIFWPAGTLHYVLHSCSYWQNTRTSKVKPFLHLPVSIQFLLPNTLLFFHTPKSASRRLYPNYFFLHCIVVVWAFLCPLCPNWNISRQMEDNAMASARGYA